MNRIECNEILKWNELSVKHKINSASYSFGSKSNHCNKYKGSLQIDLSSSSTAALPFTRREM